MFSLKRTSNTKVERVGIILAIKDKPYLKLMKCWLMNTGCKKKIESLGNLFVERVPSQLTQARVKKKSFRTGPSLRGN